ncbi:MAG: hypothetical protein IPK80_02005 [Nannocystis sp.]|nr:hypothetical protein [Nannocystis sp.]
MKALFRIDQVLRGDAPTVALLGTDGDGREVRLEVPSAAVGALRPGGVLVLDWWVGSLPIDATATATATTTTADAARPEASAASGAQGESASAPLVDVTSTSAASAAKDIDEDQLMVEFRQMFGRIPGFTAWRPHRGRVAAPRI